LSKHMSGRSALVLFAALATLALGGCGGSKQPAQQATNATAPAAPAAEVAQAEAAKAEAARAEAAKAAQLAAKEKELADREAALKQKEIELELARRDAENAAARKAKQDAVAKKTKRAPAKTAAVAATARPPRPAPPPAPVTVVVPAGTQLAIELTSAVTTKTAKVGDRVQGRLASDLIVGGRRVAFAGAPAQGSVNQVVSGSKKIGGTPTLGLAFDQLTVANGSTAAITGRLLQQGESDAVKDTAKILGGTAVGAVLGHQINHRNGAVIGGILGTGAGVAVAQNTGGEVSLAAGTVISVATEAPFQVDGL